MKKNYFYAAMAAFGLLAFSSCSSDDDPVLGQEQEELTGEQVIVLDMQDTDVLSTKSRPLFSTSSKGAEEVTHVKLFVFKVNEDKTKTVLKTIDIPNWDQIATEYDYGRKYSIRLTKNNGKIETSEASTIEIVAVGQNEKDLTPKPFTWTSNLTLSGDWSNVYTGKSWNSSATPGEGFSPLFTEKVGDSEMTPISEIFSGTSEETPIALDGGFEAKVLLKRQVAGVLGYFDNIPAKHGESHVKYVRLVASQRNTQLDLTTQLGRQNDDAENNKKDIESIVNGFTPATTADAKTFANKDGLDNDAFTVYKIDLSQWFTGYTEGQGWAAESFDKDNGNVLKAEKWVNALDPSNKKPVVKSSAVLAGEFTIPFSLVTGKNTFELQLLKSDNTVLKSWNVKLDKNSQGKGDGELVYSIYRNHLYQIGQRGDGDSPEKPGEDPDKPQSLNKDQDLVIKINDQWEFIHDMEIE